MPIYTRASDVICAGVSGAAVLLHTGNWHYYEFDPVGNSIWELLEEPRDLKSLVTALMQRFQVDEAQCLDETRSFLTEMVEEGIVIRGA